MRPPPTATLVAALSEQLAIIAEPSGLAGTCRAAQRGGGSVATNSAEAGGGVGRVFLELDVGGRRLCSEESLRGYEGVYSDIDKVAMQEL
jgi:hypothetical protein